MRFDFELDPIAFNLIKEHSDLFLNVLRGIERESLRINEIGEIAQTGHPKALGSALTHPFITTDFSEALIELVTPPLTGLENLEASLAALHQFTYQHLEHELLWPASMPPRVQDENVIRVAYYGTSNIAKMKQTYRRGLCHRYGKMMQIISGIHYNFSLPKKLFLLWNQAASQKLSLRDFTDQAYFRLMRNYFRHYWLLIYLFGASPACMKNSVSGEIPDYLKVWDKESYFAPYATSLRMSNLGYSNHSQASISISRDNLKAYVKDLLRATQSPYEPYAKLGIKDEKGEYKQLNANLLQIENEYYSAIRPKQVARSGERPAVALMERGVEYIEVRSLDVNPFLPCGIDQHQAAFMDVFLVFCLLANSDTLSKTECQESKDNLQKIVVEGRRPNLNLSCQGKAVAMQTWAKHLFDQFETIAAVMDVGVKTSAFSQAVKEGRKKIEDSNLTPSAKLLSLMQGKGQNFQELMLNQAKAYEKYFKSLSLPLNQKELDAMSEESLIEQKAIEAKDNLSFEEFIERYFAQGGSSL